MKVNGCKWHGRCQWNNCDGCAHRLPTVRISYCQRVIEDMFGEDLCGLPMTDGKCPKCGG